MKCPGQDMQYWKSEAIYEVKCPQCHKMVEFYKDDPSRKCGHCGHRFVNPKMDFGCASYCQFSEQCLGTLPEEYVAQKDNLLKDRVAVEVKKYLKNDFKTISHTTRVARHAERIGKSEEANLAIILCSAYLRDIGKNEAVRKYGSAGDDKVAQESVAIAESILKKLGAKSRLVENVCTIIDRRQSSNADGSIELNIVRDAGLIADFEEEFKNIPVDKARFTGLIENLLQTESGRREAEEIFRMGLNDMK